MANDPVAAIRSGPYPLEAVILVILECLHDLGLRIHDERPMACNRLVEGPGCDQQEARRRSVGLEGDFRPSSEHAEMALRQRFSLGPDSQSPIDREHDSRVTMGHVLLEVCLRG
jgi:hypothetical protein